MTIQTLAAPLGDIKRAGAGVGISLTTTAARTFIPRGTRWISLEPRNLSTAVVAYVAFNPYLTILKTTDLLAAIANTTDLSEVAQDNATGTAMTLSSMDTLANLGAIYVGSDIPFEGVNIDVSAANGNASVLTVAYWNGAWTSTSATDNTASGGATFAVDGSVTWTRPTDWLKRKLNEIVTGVDPSFGYAVARQMFWTRWVVSAALDSSTTTLAWLAINRTDNFASLVSGETIEQSIQVGRPGGYVSFDALTDAGTANLVCKVGGAYGNA